MDNDGWPLMVSCTFFFFGLLSLFLLSRRFRECTGWFRPWFRPRCPCHPQLRAAFWDTIDLSPNVNHRGLHCTRITSFQSFPTSASFFFRIFLVSLSLPLPQTKHDVHLPHLSDISRLWGKLYWSVPSPSRSFWGTCLPRIDLTRHHVPTNAKHPAQRNAVKTCRLSALHRRQYTKEDGGLLHDWTLETTSA